MDDFKNHWRNWNSQANLHSVVQNVQRRLMCFLSCLQMLHYSLTSALVISKFHFSETAWSKKCIFFFCVHMWKWKKKLGTNNNTVGQEMHTKIKILHHREFFITMTSDFVHGWPTQHCHMCCESLKQKIKSTRAKENKKKE